jgi:hypothetical protein
MTQGGGLLQLVAQGKQDVFLTGNPQMTWFKMVYRRHTNFSIEQQIIQFDNQADFGRRITCVIPRKGDLLSSLWLEIRLPALVTSTGIPVSYVSSIAHALIQEISIEIGEQEIDKQTGEWMEIWSNYTVSESKKQAWNQMIGKVNGGNGATATSVLTSSQNLYVPLRFWFCKNSGLALPLLALQYHPIRINITLRPLQQLYFRTLNPLAPNTPPSAAHITSMNLYGDYIHLDIDERRRFVSNAHEYLIEQVQYTQSIAIDSTASTVQVPMEFNHPIRELFWVIQRDLAITNNQWFNFTDSTVGEINNNVNDNLINTALLKIEGFDRFDIRNADYFRLVQPYQYHTTIPIDEYTYSYSFALDPESVQPSGSMNASRLDNIVLQLEMNNTSTTPARGTGNVRIYSTNHNVLRIVDGFGGILFRV